MPDLRELYQEVILEHITIPVSTAMKKSSKK